MSESLVTNLSKSALLIILDSTVVEDIAPIPRSAFGAIADPHANGGLFVAGVTAPVGFPANGARSIFRNSEKAVDSNSLSPRELVDGVLVGIGSID